MMTNFKAVLVPYCESQNEPSVPLLFLFQSSGVDSQDDQSLIDIYLEHVFAAEEDYHIIVSRPVDGYGDIVVTAEDSGVYLYATILQGDD